MLCQQICNGEAKRQRVDSGDSLCEALNTIRLRPIRQKTRNVILNILDDGWVCLEFIKERNHGTLISECIRISHDGMTVITYKPTNQNSEINDTVIPLPSHYKEYNYDSLPRKYWKRYHYAARFISRVKSVTPKVTYFSSLAKCMLMESMFDFELVFYQGPKFSITADIVKIIDSTGLNLTLDKHSDWSVLSDEMQKYWTHAKQCKSHCESLETMLRQAEASFQTSNHFPVIIGNRYLKKTDSATPSPRSDVKSYSPIKVPPPSTFQSFDGSVVTRFTTNYKSTNPVRDVSKTHENVTHQSRNVTNTLRDVAHPVRDVTNQSSYSNQHTRSSNNYQTDVASTMNSVGSTCVDSVTQKLYIKSVGWATQYRAGILQCDFDDGCQLKVHSKTANLEYSNRRGVSQQFSESDLIPDFVRSKLELLPKVISSLSNST